MTETVAANAFPKFIDTTNFEKGDLYLFIDSMDTITRNKKRRAEKERTPLKLLEQRMKQQQSDDKIKRRSVYISSNSESDNSDGSLPSQDVLCNNCGGQKSNNRILNTSDDNNKSTQFTFRKSATSYKKYPASSLCRKISSTYGKTSSKTVNFDRNYRVNGVSQKVCKPKIVGLVLKGAAITKYEDPEMRSYPDKLDRAVDHLLMEKVEILSLSETVKNPHQVMPFCSNEKLVRCALKNIRLF